MEALHTLAARYAVTFPVEAAHRLETESSEEVAAFLAALQPEVAAGVVESMLASAAAAAFEKMDREKLPPILERLPVARCVLIFRSLDKDRQATMVGLLPDGTAITVERLLRSSEGSVGILAEPIPAVLSPDMSVEEALRVSEGISLPYVYVVDADFRLRGVMHRKELAKSDQRARVGNLMSRQVIRLPATAPHSEVRNHRAWIDYDVLPVVDGSGVLVGVMRHRIIRSSTHAPPVSGVAPQAVLGALLDLGEVYWGGLTSVFSAMAGRPALEVKNGA